MNATQSREFQPADPTVLREALTRTPRETVVVIDFDGTLLLRNSTQLYLRSIRPRIVAAALLAVLDLLQPWRLLPGADQRWIYRDWIRVVAVTVLLPWSLAAWRRTAPTLAREHVNRALVAVLQAVPDRRYMVATYGFRCLVAPMLRAMDAPGRLTVSAPLLSAFQLRRTGKAQAVRALVGADAMAGSIVVTDSEDDRDFLPLSRSVFLLAPAPDSPAHSMGYIPLRYLNRCKRRGENVVARVILFYDLVALFLAYGTASARPVLTCAGLLFYQLAFWTVYELGNWENDVLGNRYETDPRLPDGFERWSRTVRPVQALIWAACLLFPASALLAAGSGRDMLSSAVSFYVFLAAYLVAGRAIYAVYNRVDPKTRVYLYPVLQLSKACGLLLVLPVSQAGLAFIVAVALVRQLRYTVYRFGDKAKGYRVPPNTHTLLCFGLLAAASLALVTPEGPSFWIVSAAVVAWHLQRGRREIAAAMRSVVWLPGRPRTLTQADAAAPP